MKTHTDNAQPKCTRLVESKRKNVNTIKFRNKHTHTHHSRHRQLLKRLVDGYVELCILPKTNSSLLSKMLYSSQALVSKSGSLPKSAQASLTWLLQAYQLPCPAIHLQHCISRGMWEEPPVVQIAPTIQAIMTAIMLIELRLIR